MGRGRGIGRVVGVIGLLLGRGCEFIPVFVCVLRGVRRAGEVLTVRRLGLTDFLRGKLVERLVEEERKELGS